MARPNTLNARSVQGSVVNLLGMSLLRATEHEVLDRVFKDLRHQRGGWLLTANLDFLRRYDKDRETRKLFEQADVTVADGMPLVWATRLLGEPVPERIAGSTLVLRLAERAEQEGRSLYLMGGDEGASEEAVRVLVQRFPALRIAGWSSPQVSLCPTEGEVSSARTELVRATPDILLVGVGSPKQERLISALREHFPGTWMVGVGISFSFLASKVRRAPRWMQDLGLEWVHRLAQEPRRLARRYLLEDLPFAIELFARVLRTRKRPTGQ